MIIGYQCDCLSAWQKLGTADRSLGEIVDTLISIYTLVFCRLILSSESLLEQDITEKLPEDDLQTWGMARSRLALPAVRRS
jgi:hypothetical protein